ncbi:MAG TPA: hypothetical protein VLF66_13300 [Thermoanaerobaculia bacterium]|nr:hypothetical protein [Thermoanaerobaculia bacterium]
MKRRILSLALLLTLWSPVAAVAGSATADPDGLTAAAPELVAWLESALRVFLSWVGV